MWQHEYGHQIGPSNPPRPLFLSIVLHLIALLGTNHETSTATEMGIVLKYLPLYSPRVL
jgi:hypothetical protein